MLKEDGMISPHDSYIEAHGDAASFNISSSQKKAPPSAYASSKNMVKHKDSLKKRKGADSSTNVKTKDKMQYIVAGESSHSKDRIPKAKMRSSTGSVRVDKNASASMMSPGLQPNHDITDLFRQQNNEFADSGNFTSQLKKVERELTSGERTAQKSREGTHIPSVTEKNVPSSIIHEFDSQKKLITFYQDTQDGASDKN